MDKYIKVENLVPDIQEAVNELPHVARVIGGTFLTMNADDEEQAKAYYYGGHEIFHALMMGHYACEKMLEVTQAQKPKIITLGGLEPHTVSSDTAPEVFVQSVTTLDGFLQNNGTDVFVALFSDMTKSKLRRLFSTALTAMLGFCEMERVNE